MNIEVASEFILVASSLMKIKSKLLVPRPEVDEEGNEIDPRSELVQRLLEYKKYKSVLADMDMVPREEFEVVREMARTAREENEELKKRLEALEAKLAEK